MAKKYYNIQLKKKDKNIDYWYNPIEGQHVSKAFVKGYIACSQSYYPSFDIRVRDAVTNLIVEEIKGNNKVKV